MRLSIIFLLTITLLIIPNSLVSCRESDSGPYTSEFSPETWVTKWFYLGPFDNENQDDFNKDLLEKYGGELNFDPAAHISQVEDYKDKIRKASDDETGYIDFIKVLGKQENRLAYAYSEIISPESGYAVLKVGSDDAVKVWINGEKVLDNYVFRAPQPDQDIVLVKILKGTNRCLVKLGQGTGGWGFFLRFGELHQPSEGINLIALKPIHIPDILVGSEFPIDQTLYLLLMNSGSVPLERADIIIESASLKSRRCPIEKLGQGEFTEVKFRLSPIPDLEADKIINISVRAKTGKKKSVDITEVRAKTRKVHPLLGKKQESSSKPFFIVQLSDPHLIKEDTVLAGVNTAERLRQAVAEVNAMNPAPDFVVVTGDILLDRMEGIPLYNEIMSGMTVPWLAAFGNHDKPFGPAAAEVYFSRWGLPPYYSVSHKGYKFFILDSVSRKNPHRGDIPVEQLSWLNYMLEYYKASEKDSKTPYMFFLHHDLFSGLGVEDIQPTQNLFDKYSNPKWLFSGHWHDDCFVKWKDQRHIITTSTGYLFGEGELKHYHDQPGYRLIHFRDGVISTQLKPLGKPPVDDPGLDDYYTREEVLEALKVE
jgi:calcineurin-like phosphoesterase family protein